MNVAHSAQTKRRTLSQQNTALEKASCFSSKPHILVELTNAGGREGYWSTTWMQGPEALLSSALFSPPPLPS